MRKHDVRECEHLAAVHNRQQRNRRDAPFLPPPPVNTTATRWEERNRVPFFPPFPASCTNLLVYHGFGTAPAGRVQKTDTS